MHAKSGGGFEGGVAHRAVECSELSVGDRGLLEERHRDYRHLAGVPTVLIDVCWGTSGDRQRPILEAFGAVKARKRGIN